MNGHMYWVSRGIVLILLLYPYLVGYKYLEGEGCNENDVVHLYWDENPDFYINAEALATDLSGLNLTPTQMAHHVVWTGSQWAVQSGSERGIVWEGLTDSGCWSRNKDGEIILSSDGKNTVSTYIPDKPSVFGQALARYKEKSGIIIETDICISKNAAWSLNENIGNSQVDFRRTLAHEFGHSFGLDHVLNTDPASVMAPVVWGRAYPDIAQDDQQYMRDFYGSADRTVRLKEYSSQSHTWIRNFIVPSVHTNLPVSGSITGDDHLMLASVDKERQKIHIHTAQMPVTSSSAVWSKTTFSYPTDSPVAIAGYGDEDAAIAAIVGPNEVYTACNEVRILMGIDYLSDPLFNFTTNVCTKTSVALAWNPDASTIVLAYTASPVPPAGKIKGGVYLRPLVLVLGIFPVFDESKEVYTGLQTGYAPDVNCDKNGACMVSIVDTSTNAKKTTRRQFTVNGSQDIVLGTMTSGSNWTNFATQLASTRNGGSSQVYEFLNFQSLLTEMSVQHMRRGTTWGNLGSNWGVGLDTTDFGMKTITHPDKPTFFRSYLED